MPIAYFADYMNIVMFVFNFFLLTTTCVVYWLPLLRTGPIELFGSKSFDLAL